LIQGASRPVSSTPAAEYHPGSRCDDFDIEEGLKFLLRSFVNHSVIGDAIDEVMKRFLENKVLPDECVRKRILRLNCNHLKAMRHIRTAAAAFLKWWPQFGEAKREQSIRSHVLQVGYGRGRVEAPLGQEQAKRRMSTSGTPSTHSRQR
jgi:hypothetical protein